MAKIVVPRWGWALTGSGHYFTECLDLVRELGDVDLFVSKAASEVARMYKKKLRLPKAPGSSRIRRRAPCLSGRSIMASITRLLVAPATSNTVAKCVFGISDTLPTNVFAQAGKCRVPAIVFACDTAPELDTPAPAGMVKVYPRRIDLENTQKLKSFDATTVAETLDELRIAVAKRRTELSNG